MLYLLQLWQYNRLDVSLSCICSAAELLSCKCQMQVRNLVLCRKATEDAAFSLDLGSFALEFGRMRPLADCELKFTLTDGRDGALPCHKALLGQHSHVMR